MNGTGLFIGMMIVGLIYFVIVFAIMFGIMRLIAMAISAYDQRSKMIRVDENIQPDLFPKGM